MDIKAGTRCEPFCEGSYGSETLQERMGMGLRKRGTDGNGIELSGNGWGRINLTVTVGDGQNFDYRAAHYFAHSRQSSDFKATLKFDVQLLTD